MVDPRIDFDLVLDPLLHLRRQFVPVIHADAEVHEIDRLIDRLEANRSHPDEFRHLLEAEVPVYRGTGVVGRLDGAFLQGGKHFAAGKQRRLGADGSEAFGDHAARNAQF